MALSKGTNLYNRQIREQSDSPILCPTCLGDNPYVRMMKKPNGIECNICKRSFTLFRWCPGRGMRFKCTVICQICAKLKNVCQTCILDLQYNLPVKVRDSVLLNSSSNNNKEIPKSEVNSEYYRQQLVIDDINTSVPMNDDRHNTQSKSVVHAQLSKLSRNHPYYKRNLPQLCTFWLKGECKRADTCPYQHQAVNCISGFVNRFDDQHVKDRYYGQHDLVADKIIKQIKSPALALDPSMTTVFISNVNASLINQTDLKNYFYQFGEIHEITIKPNKRMAFIQFTKHKYAERVISSADDQGKLIICGQTLFVNWAMNPEIL